MFLLHFKVMFFATLFCAGTSCKKSYFFIHEIKPFLSSFKNPIEIGTLYFIQQ